MAGEFPSRDMALTLLLVVDDVERSKRVYGEVLGPSSIASTEEPPWCCGSWTAGFFSSLPAGRPTTSPT